MMLETCSMKPSAINKDAIMTAFLVAIATGLGANITPLVTRAVKAVVKEFSS